MMLKVEISKIFKKGFKNKRIVWDLGIVANNWKKT